MKFNSLLTGKNHSTETTVLSVLEGLLTKPDQKLVSILAPLGLVVYVNTRAKSNFPS